MLYVFLLGNSSGYLNVYMPTFRNTLSVCSKIHRRVGMKSTYPPMKMEHTECSETSAYTIQTPGNYPEESIQHLAHFFLYWRRTQTYPTSLSSFDGHGLQIIPIMHAVPLLMLFTSSLVGRCSSVGIATGYGLDGPGIESRWGRDFPNLSRPALVTTQPSVQWIPGLSRG